jgi:hypothetical protein
MVHQRGQLPPLQRPGVLTSPSPAVSPPTLPAIDTTNPPIEAHSSDVTSEPAPLAPTGGSGPAVVQPSALQQPAVVSSSPLQQAMVAPSSPLQQPSVGPLSPPPPLPSTEQDVIAPPAVRPRYLLKAMPMIHLPDQHTSCQRLRNWFLPSLRLNTISVHVSLPFKYQCICDRSTI